MSRPTVIVSTARPGPTSRTAIPSHWLARSSAHIASALRRAAPTAPVRAQSAAPGRGDVVGGRPARLLRLPAPRPLLVHRPGGDLLGLVLATTAVLETFLDVLVPPFALFAPRLLRHVVTSSS